MSDPLPDADATLATLEAAALMLPDGPAASTAEVAWRAAPPPIWRWAGLGTRCSSATARCTTSPRRWRSIAKWRATTRRAGSSWWHAA